MTTAAAAPNKPMAGTSNMSKELQHWYETHMQNRTFGQKAADVVRNVMGSWPFVFAFVAISAAWVIYNGTALYTVLAGAPFDPFPYILLNLGYSFLAGLQGSILLISAKRADQVAAALAQSDFETNLRAKKEIEALMRKLNAIERKYLKMIISGQDKLAGLIKKGATIHKGAVAA